MCSRPFETRSRPPLSRRCPRGFAFYVALPKNSVRPLGLPIYVARVPAASIRSPLPIATLPSISLVPAARFTDDTDAQRITKSEGRMTNVERRLCGGVDRRAVADAETRRTGDRAPLPDPYENPDRCPKKIVLVSLLLHYKLRFPRCLPSPEPGGWA